MSKYDEIPITVDNINLKFVTDGPKDQKSIGRTNEAFVQKIFARTKGAETVSQLFRSLQEGTMALASLGMYKTVDFELKECKKPLTTDLLIKLKEKGPFYGNAGVGMSSTRREPMMKIEGLLRNVFGNAEILKGAFSYGVNQTGSFDLTFAKPKSFSSGNPLEPPYGTLAAAAHYNGGTLFRDSNFVEKSSGITLKAESDDKRHLLEYLGAWRDVLPHEASGINTNPEERKGPRLHSNSVLKASMPSLKSALRYTYTYDKTNHKLTPTEGAYVRCSTELAGLGGDVAFAKLEGCGRIHVPLNEHVSVGVGCFGGLLATVSGRDSGVPFFGVPSMINDRFFHRGFRSTSYHLSHLIHTQIFIHTCVHTTRIVYVQIRQEAPSM